MTDIPPTTDPTPTPEPPAPADPPTPDPAPTTPPPADPPAAPEPKPGLSDDEVDRIADALHKRAQPAAPAKVAPAPAKKDPEPPKATPEKQAEVVREYGSSTWFNRTKKKGAGGDNA